jgi:outer membrane protein assembly factor BamB
MRRLTTLFVYFGCAFVFAGGAGAQGRGGADWTTAGNDAQRSSWVRADPKISKDSMQKPGFQLLWKIKFENEARQLNGLTPAVLLDRYIGHRGFRSLAFIGGSADNVFAVDTDLGRIEWQNHYSTGPAGQPGSLSCPGGITTGLTRPTSTALPVAMGGRGGGGGGRGGPAKSGVGEPGQGAVTLAEVAQGRGGRGGLADAPPAGRGAPGAPGDAGRGAARGGGFGRMPSMAYALTSDGVLQTLYVSNGADAEAPVKFLPANANAQGLIVADNVAYAVTSNGCGGAANGVWALDLASKEVTTWKSGASSPVGSAGPAFGPDGTLYVATAGGEASLVALEPKTLKRKASYSAGSDFTSSPVVFEYKGKIIVAAGTKDGRVHLLDSASLTAGASSRTSDGAATGLASWQDAGGTRWILAAAASAVITWKVADGPSLEPGWVSRDIVSPLTPMIVNGVVFAVSRGESSHAVLYALDAGTGNPLWNSGNNIGSFVHGGGLSAGSGQLYLGTHDGTLYAFGFPIEH